MTNSIRFSLEILSLQNYTTNTKSYKSTKLPLITRLILEHCTLSEKGDTLSYSFWTVHLSWGVHWLLPVVKSWKPKIQRPTTNVFTLLLKSMCFKIVPFWDFPTCSLRIFSKPTWLIFENPKCELRLVLTIISPNNLNYFHPCPGNNLNWNHKSFER